MNSHELFDLIANANALFTATHDPLIPSAIKLIADAATSTLLDEDYEPTPQQRIAIGMVEAMCDAYLCLYGFSDTQPVWTNGKP